MAKGNFNVVTYTLPAYWASYLINRDGSGIDESDRHAADAFLARYNLPEPVDVSEQYFSHRNDAGTLAGDVAEYTFLIRKKKTKPNPIRRRPIVRRELSIPEQHQRRIAERTLRMPDAMVGVMGGPTKSQARRILKANPRRRTGKVKARQNPKRGPYTGQIALRRRMVREQQYEIAPGVFSPDPSAIVVPGRKFAGYPRPAHRSRHEIAPGVFSPGPSAIVVPGRKFAGYPRPAHRSCHPKFPMRKRVKTNPKLPYRPGCQIRVFQLLRSYHVYVKQPGHWDAYVYWSGLRKGKFQEAVKGNDIRQFHQDDMELKNVPDDLFAWIKSLFCKQK